MIIYLRKKYNLKNKMDYSKKDKNKFKMSNVQSHRVIKSYIKYSIYIIIEKFI